MSLTFRIESATTSQLPVLADLLGILFAQEREFEVHRQRQIDGLSAILAQPARGSVLVASDTERVLGMVVVLYSISTALGAEVATLEDLIVQPDVRGHGVGHALIRSALDAAVARGCKRVSLLTDADNRQAQSLYAQHGFRLSTMRPMRWFPAQQGAD